MRMQDSQANCGPYALMNALRALGIERTSAELEAACRTSATNGTSLANILRAAAQIDGCNPCRVVEKRRDVAMLRLHAAVSRGRSAVLSWCDEAPGDHWVAVVGMLGERYLIADSADSELVLSFHVAEVEARWKDSRYEGVIL